MNIRAETESGDRLFIGIECDANTREEIESVRQPMVNQMTGIAWVPGENFHLTLAFLGTVSSVRSKYLVSRLKENHRESRCFTYHLKRLSRFPNPDGGVIALVGDANKKLGTLYENTLALLQSTGLDPAWNTFKPHITLGRIRKPAKLSDRIDLPVDIRLYVDAVTLYKSVLRPSGSVYSVLKKVSLGTPET